MGWFRIPNGGGGGSPGGAPLTILGAKTILIAQSSNATDDRTGLDKYDHARPFLTGAGAAAVAAAGDTLHFRSGKYTGDWSLAGGTVSDPIGIQGDAAVIIDGKVTITSGNVTIDDVRIQPSTVEKAEVLEIGASASVTATGVTVSQTRTTGVGDTAAVKISAGGGVFAFSCDLNATNTGAGTGTDRTAAVFIDGDGSFTALASKLLTSVSVFNQDAACVWLKDTTAGAIQLDNCLMDTLAIVQSAAHQHAVLRGEGTASVEPAINGGTWRYGDFFSAPSNMMLVYAPTSTIKPVLANVVAQKASATAGSGTLYTAGAEFAGCDVTLLNVSFADVAVFPSRFPITTDAGSVVKTGWNSAGDLCLGAAGAKIQMTDAPGTTTSAVTLTTGGGSLTVTP